MYVYKTKYKKHTFKHKFKSHTISENCSWNLNENKVYIINFILIWSSGIGH